MIETDRQQIFTVQVVDKNGFPVAQLLRSTTSGWIRCKREIELTGWDAPTAFWFKPMEYRVEKATRMLMKQGEDILKVEERLDKAHEQARALSKEISPKTGVR